MGPEGSGSRLTWDRIQGASAGRRLRRRKLSTCRSTPSAPRYPPARFDAALLVVGHPSGRIGAILGGCALTLLPVEGPAIDAFVAARPYFTKRRISDAHYELSADVPTFGVTALLMTTADMDARVVAEFARSLTAQIDTLKTKTPGAGKSD